MLRSMDFQSVTFRRGTQTGIHCYLSDELSPSNTDVATRWLCQLQLQSANYELLTRSVSEELGLTNPKRERGTRINKPKR